MYKQKCLLDLQKKTTIMNQKEFFKAEFNLNVDQPIFWKGRRVSNVNFNKMTMGGNIPVKLEGERRKMDVKIEELKNHDKFNQHRFNFPQLGPNQKWNLIGYLYGNRINKCERTLESFSSLQYIRRSKDVHHVIADGGIILVCSIIFNK